MSDRVTYMHSGQLGAPQMNGAPGSNGQMLQVLDACLVDGFNSQTVTTATKTATSVTLTFGTSHGYVERQLINVSGATDAGLNGNHKVISLTTNTITINAVGVGVTTGSITTKITPLGFESIFGSVAPLKRAYRSKDAQSTKTVLYLDMNLPAGNGYHATNPSKRAMVSLCEDMTTLGVQINSYTDTRNSYDSNPNGSLFWHQAKGRSKAASVTTATNSKWVVIGNGSFFYFLTEWTDDATIRGRGTGLRDLYGFGDLPSLSGISDRYNCAWLGSYSVNDVIQSSFSSNGARIGGDPSSTASKQGFFISDYNGIGGLQDFVITHDGRGSVAATASGYELKGALFPNPSTVSVIGFPTYAMQVGDIRASMPNLHYLPHNISLTDSTNDLTMNGGLLLTAMHNNVNASAFYGWLGFNIGE